MDWEQTLQELGGFEDKLPQRVAASEKNSGFLAISVVNINMLSGSMASAQNGTSLRSMLWKDRSI